MNLQYQLSSGAWRDCGDRTEAFLARCEKFNGIGTDGKMCAAFRAVRLLTRDEVLVALADGQSLRNDIADWYSNCRDCSGVEAAALRAAQPTAEMRRCSCGHTVPDNSVMSASRGSSCPRCYDRMSD
jgi:hypothetical protein